MVYAATFCHSAASHWLGIRAALLILNSWISELLVNVKQGFNYSEPRGPEVSDVQFQKSI